jgi:DNA polymerase-3 subunit beta
MVLVKAKCEEILGPLSAVSGIIERRHTLPILSNVLIDRSGDVLSFLATDIEIQIRARSAAKADGEARAVTVGARKLLDILRALPEGVEVTLQQQDKRLLVKAGKSRFTLQTLPAEDFPKLAKPEGETARFTLSQKALRRLLGLVQYSMAQQDIRYYLNGLLMVAEDKQLKVVATDGHRLAFASLKLAADLPRQEVIVPRKTVLELSKLLGDVDDEVKIELSATQASFTFGSIELVSKLVDGKFPDYTRVIPTGHKNKLQIEREPLRQALQRAAILSNEKFRGVRWVLSDGSLKIVSSNAEQEEAHEELEVKYSGDALDIGFNVNYLLDVLNNVGGSAVDCAFGDSSSSALLSYASEKDFKYVVMPMRIRIGRSRKASARIERLRLGLHQGSEGPGGRPQAARDVHRRHVRRHRAAPHGFRGGRQRRRRSAGRLLRRNHGDDPHRQLHLGPRQRARHSDRHQG